jgi:hypothetical protein
MNEYFGVDLGIMLYDVLLAVNIKFTVLWGLSSYCKYNYLVD